MYNNASVFYSNHLENLLGNLRDSLFASGSTAFTRRLLIVPQPEMKAWLQWNLAKDPSLNVATGIEFCFLKEAISKIGDGLHSDWLSGKSKGIPSRLEVSLRLEAEIRKVLQQFDSLSYESQEIWNPLLHYLKAFPPHKKEEIVLSRKSEKRLTALCSVLSKLFEDYGVYGNEMVKSWEETPLPGWQQQLWRQVFSGDCKWEYPSRLMAAFDPSKAVPCDMQIHLFAFSFLPEIEHRFLLSCSEKVPVHYYLLSPCLAFWTDIRSDREGRRLKTFWRGQGVSKEEQRSLEQYLRDRNPLLANFGRLGRHFISFVEDSQINAEERYHIPGGVQGIPQYEDCLLEEVDREGELTLLQAVQVDMLLLRNPDLADKVSFSSYDHSIQVHSAPSMRREVEVLYDTLLRIIERHRQDREPISPGDIIVMAPDIAEYEPYINAVFGSEESVLDFRFMDIQMSSKSLLVQGFLSLLQLQFGRWDTVSVLELFDHPLFQRRHHLSEDDVQRIRRWLRDSGVRWGENESHRHEILKQGGCKEMIESRPVATWEHGIEQLLLGLSMVAGESDAPEMDQYPLQGVLWSHADLLEKFIALFRSLRQDLKPLSDGTALSLGEWVDYLECLLEAYFSIDYADKEAVEGHRELLEKISLFKKASRRLKEEKYTFVTIFHHLESFLKEGNSHLREGHLQTIQFCSMVPMRSIPAKVVAILGLDDSNYPRRDNRLSLNLLRSHKGGDYCPSLNDYDRYLFLEALISARQYFLISYQGRSSFDQAECLPSLLVTELLAYLDRSYSVEGKAPSECFLKGHPAYAFHFSYFDNSNKPHQTFSRVQYRLAQAYYKAEKDIPHRFIPELFNIGRSPQRAPEGSQKELTVNLNKLSEVARNPLKTYFRGALGIFLEKSEEIKGEEDFSLSSLDRFVLSREALFYPIDRVLEAADKKGKLPLGAFKKIAIKEVEESLEAIQNYLQKKGISSETLFDIELKKECEAPYKKDDRHWIYPALKVDCSNSVRVSLVGDLRYMTQKGILVNGDKNIPSLAKAWPQILALNCLQKTASNPIENNVLLLKSKSDKERKIDFQDPLMSMKRFLDYYMICLTNASPLIPEWLPSVLKNDSEKLQKEINQTLDDKKHFHNEYASWSFSSSDPLSAEALLSDWSDWAREAFEGIERVGEEEIDAIV